MKLEFPKIPTETSHTFENENFSLGDIRVIMNLLSSKIYSRPKYIIVQEVGSNARDANREAGRPDTPIRVKLPNRFDDNFIIADNGIGISPERMSEVFLKYGNSTKRKDNVLTGGFGIGAKTPFTYTDSFTVVTTTDDNDGVRRKRTYIAHKAEDVFRMSLVTTEEAPNELTGTAIGFAVEPGDFGDFEYATREVFRYWSPQPVIEGKLDWAWPIEKTIHEGDDWALVNTGGPKVLIDRIPYTLRLESIFKDTWNNETYNVLKNTNIRLYFETGEVDVSATREDLDYQTRTIQAIKDKADKALAEVRKDIDDKFANFDTLWEASKQWNENRHSYQGFIVEPKWNGKNMLPSKIGVGGMVKASDHPTITAHGNWIRPQDHIKITVYERDGHDVSTKKAGWRGRTIVRDIRIADDIIVTVDDSGSSRPNKRRLITLFENNPDATEVAVVTFKTPDAEKVAKATMHWDEIPHVKLSTIAKAPKVINPNTGRTYSVNAVKKLVNGARSYKWTPAKDRAPEDTDGGIYVLLKNGNPVTSDGKVIDKDDVMRLRSLLNENNVYAILWKYRNKIAQEWEEVTAKATLKAAELRASENVKAHIEDGSRSASDTIGSDIYDYIVKNKSKIDDKTFVAILDRSKKVESGAEDYYTYCSIMRALNQTPDGVKEGLKKALSSFKKTYPMLPLWKDCIRWNSKADTASEEFIFYLNAKYAASVAGDSNADD